MRARIDQDVDVAAELAGLVAEGSSALDRGDWAAAREAFTAALTYGEGAESLDGMARALFSLGEYGSAISYGERAFAQYRATGDDVRAASCARFVGYLHWVVHGNGSALNGWLGLAVRLIGAAAITRNGPGSSSPGPP